MLIRFLIQIKTTSFFLVDVVVVYFSNSVYVNSFSNFFFKSYLLKIYFSHFTFLYLSAIFIFSLLFISQF